MLKYAKIINETTNEVSIALGNNPPTDYVEMEVEEAYNGAWYLVGYAPEKPAPTKEEISALREQAYINEIDTLHAKRQRKTILGTWTEEDEANYIAEVKQLSEDIANRYPYPTEE